MHLLPRSKTGGDEGQRTGDDLPPAPWHTLQKRPKALRFSGTTALEKKFRCSGLSGLTSHQGFRGSGVLGFRGLGFSLSGFRVFEVMLTDKPP